MAAIRHNAHAASQTIAAVVDQAEDSGLQLNLSGALGKLLLGDSEDDTARRKELEPEAREMFSAVDVDGNGLLDPEELKQLAAKLGMDLSEGQVEQVMAEIDTDGSGEVDFEEVKMVMLSRFACCASR